MQAKIGGMPPLTWEKRNGDNFWDDGGHMATNRDHERFCAPLEESEEEKARDPFAGPVFAPIPLLGVGGVLGCCLDPPWIPAQQRPAFSLRDAGRIFCLH